MPQEINLTSIFDKPDTLYAFGKLAEAVDDLVTGIGPLQERLGEAMTRLVPVSPDEMPGELVHDLIAIKRDLSCGKPEGNEGSIMATLRTLGNEDASAIARRILDLYTAVGDHLRRSEPPAI